MNEAENRKQSKTIILMNGCLKRSKKLTKLYRD